MRVSCASRRTWLEGWRHLETSVASGTGWSSTYTEPPCDCTDSLELTLVALTRTWPAPRLASRVESVAPSTWSEAEGGRRHQAPMERVAKRVPGATLTSGSPCPTSSSAWYTTNVVGAPSGTRTVSVQIRLHAWYGRWVQPNSCVL